MLVTAAVFYFVFWDAVVPGQDVMTLPERGNLSDRIFTRYLDLRGAVLGREIGPGGAESSRPILSLEGQDLRHANLAEATLIAPRLYGADLSFANLFGATLIDPVLWSEGGPAKVQVSTRKPKARANLSFVKAMTAKFDGADLAGVDFTGATLTSASFQGAELERAAFTGAALEFANFKGADLAGADFAMASAAGADFRYAILRSANFTAADLRGAIVFRTVLSLAQFHLADLTAVRLARLPTAEFSGFKDKLRGRAPRSNETSKALRQVETLEQMPLSGSSTEPVFGIVTPLALLARHDFLEFSSLPHPLAQAEYRTWWINHVAQTVAKDPELRAALLSRASFTEGLFVRAALSRVFLPSGAKPHEPSVSTLRALAFTLEHVWTAAGLAAKSELDNRYGLLVQKIHQPTPSPTQALFVEMLSHTQNVPPPTAFEPIFRRALEGDTLAVDVSARLLQTVPRANRDARMVELVLAAGFYETATPERVIAAADLLDADLLGQREKKIELLTRAKENDDAIARLAQLESENWRESLRAAASRGHVRSIESLIDELAVAAAEPDEETWRWLHGAAARGSSKAQCYIGQKMHAAGDFPAALTYLEMAAETGFPPFDHALAWLLATCPDASIRSPERAIERARRALRHVSEDSPFRPEFLGTLAAAYAANGNFDRAVTLQQQALDLVDSAEKRDQLAAYKAHKTWTDFGDASPR